MGEITQILERARARISRNEVPVNLIAEIGSPSARIVNHAEDYDLTVIGAKGRGASGSPSGGQGGLGPVASRVVEHALAPVLVGARA